jgi:hypothetical protein
LLFSGLAPANGVMGAGYLIPVANKNSGESHLKFATT